MSNWQKFKAVKLIDVDGRIVQPGQEFSLRKKKRIAAMRRFIASGAVKRVQVDEKVSRKSDRESTDNQSDT